jgi:LysR family nod box-dependent transcriptional activator
MRHHRLDLNLLVALDALLEESSVSRAAERVFITQSAMSNALSRLRKHFGDDLITQVGRRMVLTERGQQLRPEIRAILLKIQQVARPADVFDPLTARQEFRIGASDYFGMVALPQLIEYLSQHAPHITVEVLPLTARLFEDVERGDVDLLVIPSRYTVKNLSVEVLFEDEWCCVTWSGLKLAREGLTLNKFLALEHVAKRDNSPNFPSVIELDLARKRLQRRVAVRVPHYGLVPLMVMGTERVATVQARIAEMYVRWNLPLAQHACPFPSSAIDESMQWHPMREQDTSHQWLRKTVAQVCSGLRR